MLKPGPASPAIAGLLERHPEGVLAWHECLGDATVEVDPAQLVPVMAWLRDESGERFETLCDLTAVDRLGREPRFDLVYHLRSPATRARLRVKAAVEAQIASLAPLWPAADWLEREVFDLYGIDFAGHPDLRRILLVPDFEGHPLRKDFAKSRRPADSRPPACGGRGPAAASKGTRTGDLNAPLRRLELGPEHPTTRGALALRLQIEGERIADLEVEIGVLHRGFEKECESRSWYQALVYVDRLDTHSSLLSSVGFCLALEKLLGIETPPRCHWLRVLASELSRVGSHLNRLTQLALSLQATDLFERASAARELGRDLQEALCGARVTTHYIRIGGLAHAMPPGFPERCRQGIETLRQQLAAIAGAPTRSRAFVERLRGCGVLSREDCLRYAVTGPLLRAAGVASDLRKDEPYLCYDEIDFDVPVGEVGDNYDRHLVCMEEMRQSLRIAEQCLARLVQLGPGPLDVFDARVRWPGKERVSAQLQDLIQHCKGVSEGPLVPAGEVYAASESANGELGFYLVSDGTSRPVKLRCRAPSFFHLQPLPQMARGARLADLAATFDLVNAVAGECDR